MAAKAQIAIVLHAHLPYVLGHGRWPHGEEWLYEAAAECYLPLCGLLQRRLDRGRRERVLTLGLTPVLCEMLRDDRFRWGLQSWLEEQAQAAQEDAAVFLEQGGVEAEHFAHLARRLALRCSVELRRFRELGADLIGAFRRFADLGLIELLGGPATHPYSPLLSGESALRLQYATGRQVFQDCFGRSPEGCWLPECGYRPAGVAKTGAGRPVLHPRGMEEVLADHGMRFFFVESHLLAPVQGMAAGSARWGEAMESWPRSAPGLRGPARAEWAAPTYVGRGTKVAAFARDPFCGAQVWSQEAGYPGHGAYQEFHRRHHPGGHRYWAITDPKRGLGDKVAYRPEGARAAVAEQARHFLHALQTRTATLPMEGPVLCAPFDAELFGHWWVEGPQWLEAVLDGLDDHPRLAATTPGAALERTAVRPARSLAPGSWGEGGDDRTWSGEHAREHWCAIEAAERRVADWWPRPLADALDARLRRQAARSLLLMQASDWPFLIARGQAVDYAEARLRGHVQDFQFLSQAAQDRDREGQLQGPQLRLLAQLEQRDRLFARVDPVWTENQDLH